MSIFNKTPSVTIASPEIKAKIIQAMANSDHRVFVNSFYNSDFMLIPAIDKCYRIWAAQWSDVTVLVWEYGDDVNDWIVKTQAW